MEGVALFLVDRNSFTEVGKEGRGSLFGQAGVGSVWG